MSLLTIVQSAATKIGIPQPSTVVSNNDPQVETLLTFANEEGEELARYGPWEEITKEKTFVSVAQDEQTGALPSDFVAFINGSFFNRSSRRKVFGPISPQQWQREEATIVASGISDFFRVRGGEILITPEIPAGETLAFEYISSLWVDTDADNVADSAVWVADDDTSVLEERLISLGIVWRFLAKSGLPWNTQHATYITEVEKALGRQGGAPVLNMATGGGIVLGPGNVPETGYG